MEDKFGCKNCGKVIQLRIREGYNDCEIKIEEGGKIYNNYDGMQIQCNDCSTTVAKIIIQRT
jgi:hypothetical protein